MLEIWKFWILGNKFCNESCILVSLGVKNKFEFGHGPKLAQSRYYLCQLSANYKCNNLLEFVVSFFSLLSSNRIKWFEEFGGFILYTSLCS